MLATVLSGTAMAATIATAFFVWIQAGLLRAQNQMQAVIQLDGVWNSERMRTLRGRWAADEGKNRLGQDDRDLDSLEPILEFLEEFAGLHKRKVLDRGIIWDSTIGWHATRYYFYNKENGNLGRLRDRWIDGTLYQNLDALWQDYLKAEREERGISEHEAVRQIRESKQAFARSEQNASRLPENTD
jgi:hypothetical protein